MKNDPNLKIVEAIDENYGSFPIELRTALKLQEQGVTSEQVLACMKIFREIPDPIYDKVYSALRDLERGQVDPHSAQFNYYWAKQYKRQLRLDKKKKS